MKSCYLFEDFVVQTDGIDFAMYLLSKTIQMIYDTPITAEN